MLRQPPLMGLPDFNDLCKRKLGGKLKPCCLRKEHRLQASIWISIANVFQMCTKYDACVCPSAQRVQQLKASNAKCSPGKHTSLKVSQSTSINEAYTKLAEAVKLCMS